MNQMDKGAALISEIADLKEKEVLEIARARLDAGDDPLAIIDDCQKGMVQVGQRYQREIYFLSGLIMAGEIFQQVMEMVRHKVEAQFTGQISGRILLGTVQGDMHDIGRNIVSMLLTCHGFSVVDLGVDVPPAQFASQMCATNPDIIGLSCLLTHAYDAMRETISGFRSQLAMPGSTVPVIIGGGQLSSEVCEYVGADYWVNDAMTGVRLCQELIAHK